MGGSGGITGTLALADTAGLAGAITGDGGGATGAAGTAGVAVPDVPRFPKPPLMISGSLAQARQIEHRAFLHPLFGATGDLPRNVEELLIDFVRRGNFRDHLAVV